MSVLPTGQPAGRISTGVTPASQPAPTLPQSPGFEGQLEDLLAPRTQAPSAKEKTHSPLQFSRHAQSRLESRGIQLGAEDKASLGTAVDRLAQKGAQESLVLMGDHAFIVGVQNRTVITAMSRDEAMGNIFTQIDSTLVVP